MALKPVSIKQEVSDIEWQTRCELAALYRILSNLRMTDLIYTHLSARVPDQPEAFLINHYGELFDEVTASSLVKIDLNGNVLGSNKGYNSAGFTIHSACYISREDIMSVVHLHTKASIAVASVESGLLPISQQSLYVINDLAYHDYEGPATDLEERDIIGKNLAKKNNLLLRNHGLLSVGRSVSEAFRNAYYLEKSCEIQLATQSLGEDLILMSDDMVNRVGKEKAKQFRPPDDLGRLEWDALVRQLDRQRSNFRQ